MKKLLYLLFLVLLTSCDRTEYVEPTYETITNKGLQTIKSNQYFNATVRCTLKLANNSVKITTQVVKFNIAEYRNGMLELKFHQVCTGVNPVMIENYNILCDSYSFSNVVVKDCQN